MYLFLLTPSQSPSPGSIAACIVVAPDPDTAQCLHPNYPDVRYSAYENQWVRMVFDHPMPCGDEGWTSPFNVQVRCVGEAIEGLDMGVLMAELARG